MRKQIHSPPPATSQAPAASNIELFYRPDPNRTHPPVDASVALPRQVRIAVERAEDLLAGRRPRHFPTDVQIAAAVAWMKVRATPADPDSLIAREVLEEGARIIKNRRRGARKPRKPSNSARQRRQAALAAFRELSLELQQHPTSKETVERLRESIGKKIKRQVSPAVVLKDSAEIHQLLMQPPPAREPSEQTLRERTARTAIIELIRRRFWKLTT